MKRLAGFIGEAMLILALLGSGACVQKVDVTKLATVNYSPERYQAQAVGQTTKPEIGERFGRPDQVWTGDEKDLGRRIQAKSEAPPALAPGRYDLWVYRTVVRPNQTPAGSSEGHQGEEHHWEISFAFDAANLLVWKQATDTIRNAGDEEKRSKSGWSREQEGRVFWACTQYDARKLMDGRPADTRFCNCLVQTGRDNFSFQEMEPWLAELAAGEIKDSVVIHQILKSCAAIGGPKTPIIEEIKE